MTELRHDITVAARSGLAWMGRREEREARTERGSARVDVARHDIAGCVVRTNDDELCASRND